MTEKFTNKIRWSLSILVLLTFIEEICSFSLTPCDIPTNLRVRVGDSTNEKSVCDAGYLCYESGFGCFIDKNETPGFKKLGINTDCAGNDMVYGGSSSTEECASRCAKLSTCVGFLTNTVNHCWIKSYCHIITGLHGHMPYYRYMDDRFTCFIGGLDNLPTETYVGPNKEVQKNNAIANNKAIILTKEGLKIKDGTLNDINKQYDQVTCFPGKMIVNEADGQKSFHINHVTFDNDTSTCQLSKSNPFKIRFPWPTSNSDKLSFTVKLEGEALECLDYESWVGKNGLLVYVPLDFQVESTFNGNFKGCNIKTAGSTLCEYNCNCGTSYCQSYYVNFQDESETMKLCEVKTIF